MKKKEKEKSVFILGAGASYNYGYPLGTDLRHKIIQNYKSVLNELNRIIRNDFPDFVSSSQSFIDRFNRSSDTSIDLFLSKFPDYEFVGKIAIIYNILQAENESKFREELIGAKKIQNKENDDWMWVLYDKISKKYNSTKSIDEMNFDHVSFISFNYDRSLEHFFHSSFQGGFDFQKIGGSPHELLNRVKIEHVYGKVAYLDWETQNDLLKLTYHSYNIGNQPLQMFVNNIRIIYERTSENLVAIQELIKQADKIYFLGFGFDETNLKIIGFPSIIKENQKIYATGLNLFDEEIANIKRRLKRLGMNYGPTIIKGNCTELVRRFYFE
jgi:hypothetical protein